MPTPYRAIFSVPGARSFTAAGLISRLPVAMMGLGIVTMVSQLTGAYGLAGALAATVALSVAVFGPQVSRLVDRHGQRRVLRPAAAITVSAVGALTLSTVLGWPTWTLFVFAVCSGCVPSVGSMVRARWSALLRDSPARLHAAYSWETIVDEVCFVFGPIIAIGLSTVWFPQAGPLAAATFLAVGVFWLTAQRATEPVPAPRGTHGRGSALRTPGLPLPVLTMVMIGVIFSSVDVITVAFADERGAKSAASLLLSGYALGSCLAGAVFGMVHPVGPVERRWFRGVCAVAVSMIPLQLAGSLPFLAVALFLAGMAVAPTMIAMVGLVDQLVPRSRLTEGMTWSSTGIAVGVSLGASVAGWVVDRVGAERAFAVPAAAGATAAALAFLGHRRLVRRPVAGRDQEGTRNERDHRSEKERDERHLA
ncbi:MFS transporter [Streptomyces sp. OF3]|uniref:MFS transporter n=1 Tax=Streptomyces alkaliterrae TaxID=2213162 RepID=A0A7W3WI16_9ACTN|nr:MFS transporter [Streptomyces alkaliterrae]MBB1252240.1 MFS transporter [Streptomyces alkaliterrae]